MLGILWIAALATGQEQPSDPPSSPPAANSAPQDTSQPEDVGPQADSPRDDILGSLPTEWSGSSDQRPAVCFEPAPDPKNDTPSSGALRVHSEMLVQVTGRMDTADRRGLAARAEFCNRRLDLSASQPAPERPSPTPVPGPGSVGVILAGATLALRRRRRE